MTSEWELLFIVVDGSSKTSCLSQGFHGEAKLTENLLSASSILPPRMICRFHRVGGAGPQRCIKTGFPSFHRLPLHHRGVWAGGVDVDTFKCAYFLAQKGHSLRLSPIHLLTSTES